MHATLTCWFLAEDFGYQQLSCSAAVLSLGWAVWGVQRSYIMRSRGTRGQRSLRAMRRERLALQRCRRRVMLQKLARRGRRLLRNVIHRWWAQRVLVSRLRHLMTYGGRWE
jgi:hypothetical protein